MSSDLSALILERARLAGVEISHPLNIRLLAYYELLARWNRKINLTSLSNTDEAIDRLLIEPVVAAGALRREARILDLGSGGGSPAIPLALALGAPALIMVESRHRKAAFLREAARVVEITAIVEAVRFEELDASSSYRAAVDLVSIRAVRTDAATLDLAGRFLTPAGSIALFASAPPAEVPPSLRVTGSSALVGASVLVRLGRADVPRGT